MSKFFQYFDENMKSMGLVAPKNLFSSSMTTVATAKTILGAIDKLGADATIGEIVGATTGLEALGVVAAVGAVYYLGAIIGSLAVATGRVLGHGARISDALAFATTNQIYRPWLSNVLNVYPGIVDTNRKGRILYKSMMVA